MEVASSSCAGEDFLRVQRHVSKHARLTGDSTLALAVNVSVNGCFSVLAFAKDEHS